MRERKLLLAAFLIFLFTLPHILASPLSEGGYTLSSIVDPSVSGNMVTEGDYNISYNFYTSGFGGLYFESNYEIYLVPQQAFISYFNDITADDPDTLPPRLAFVDPTPNASASLPSSTTNVTINVSITEKHPDTLILSWNGDNESHSYSAGTWNITMSVSAGTSYTFYVWANDTLGNSNQTGKRTFSVQSSGNGGGGGGGGPPAPEDKETEGKTVAPTEPTVKAQINAEFSKIDEGKTGTITIPEAEDMPLTELKIKVNKKCTNVRVEMKALLARPAESVPEAEGKVLKYLRIDHENIKDEDVDTVTIKFKVGKSWLTKEGISPSKVVLKRYADGKWESLKTGKLDEDDDNVYYYAESPGLSVFAISESVVSKPASFSPKTPSPPATTAPLETAPPTVPLKVAPPEEPKKGICGPTVLVLLALLPILSRRVLL